MLMENAAQVRHLRELLVLGNDKESTRYTFARAKQAGFTFEQVFQAADDQNCPPHDCVKTLKVAGYTEACTVYFGDTVEQIVQRMHVCTTEEKAAVLKHIRALTDASFDAVHGLFFHQPEVMKLAGYTCADAHATLRRTDYSNFEGRLRMRVGDEGGLQKPLRELRQGRRFCSSDELDETKRYLKTYGVAVETFIDWLILAEYTPEELRRSKFTLEEINNGLHRRDSPY